MSFPPVDVNGRQGTRLIDSSSERTVRIPTLDFSDYGNEDDAEDEHDKSYSSRMEELVGEDEDQGSDLLNGRSDDEDAFLYDGVDAGDLSGNYRERLRDVLGADHDDSGISEEEVERSLMPTRDIEKSSGSSDRADDDDVFSNRDTSFSPDSPSVSMTPLRVGSPAASETPLKWAKPFLHPSISRLRSGTPQSPHTLSVSSSVGTNRSHVFDVPSPSPSRFSSVSRTSSSSKADQLGSPNDQSQSDEDVFRWTPLRSINQRIFPSSSSQNPALSNASPMFPTVLAANGLICLGTDNGNILVYDFKQKLRCICGSESPANAVGPVSALALSHDHTYVASGHTTGHIQLFDLSKPHAPARFIVPPPLSAIVSGRKEGHLAGSRIVSIGFVGERHTAVVSADEHGLAFYHSLGKVLFVEAPDILRILGKYPKELVDSLALPSSTARSRPVMASSRGLKTRYTILAMMPLPLGTSPHPTDGYHIIALLTPAKLVLVGLKPAPKTWFKRSRESTEDAATWPRAKWKGTLAWFPSVSTSMPSEVERANGNSKPHAEGTTTPVLVYTWGTTLYLVSVSVSKIKQMARNSRTGKMKEVEVGTIVAKDQGKWTSDDIILAVQRLNTNQLIIVTPSTMGVYDIRLSKLIEHVPFGAHSLISPSHASKPDDATPSSEDVAHSIRVYKGKIFLLGWENLEVGTLLTWADRILSYVQEGDFLKAVDLSRSYYLGEAPGNTNGLPDDPQLRKELVGEKMRGLMVASARYAFSEDRMTDGTHVTPNGRGVDRTSLFEGLVATCARACVALDDFEFLFEELFQQYEDAGIARIFLLQLQAFVLDNSIRQVPPRITQQLVALFEHDGRLDLAERIIWHIDPACLDINQAIHLCQTHHLYDALIYVYTRALRDYVSPVVELLGLVRRVQRYRRSRMESVATNGNGEVLLDDATMEPIILDAYKLYPYLSNTLSGLTYPSEEPLEPEEAFQAKKDVYTFLFFGRSSVWPMAEGGKLVLTADEEGGVEPTYPYTRLLLLFDAESFLHSLDIAFEDAYLNDESHAVNRLVIIKILSEILTSGDLSPNDSTFVNIFIARNVPKYPQFIQIAPSALHGILIGLAEDPDPSTREDRQLAVEYLLSVYNPHESDRVLRLFENAGFFRILRSWHRQERRWAPLLSTYLQDPDLRPMEIFSNIDEVLKTSKRSNKGKLPPELLTTIADAMPFLLQASVERTALLLDDQIPTFHEKAMEALGPEGDRERFLYLRTLLGPLSETDADVPRHFGPSQKVAEPLRDLYISLQCQYYPSEVVWVLKHLPSGFLDWTRVAETCEKREVFDAVVWIENWQGRPRGALTKSVNFEKVLTRRIVDALSTTDKAVTPEAASNVRQEVHALESVGRSAMTVCLERSQDPSSDEEVSLEDIWFQLLSSQIHSVQSVSGCCSAEALSGSIHDTFEDETVELEWTTLSALRSLVQETFGALLSISSTRAVSFPRLFKRLVDPAMHAHTSAGTPYKEFRTILDGMLESYRTDGDMLVITKHLVDRDLFDAIEDVSQERARGWSPPHPTCVYCQKPLLGDSKSGAASSQVVEGNNVDHVMRIVVSRTGVMYHSTCSPP